MSSNFFTLSVKGSTVVYSNADGESTMSLVKAWRYLKHCGAVKVAGDKRQISGAYVIEEDK
jgi:hypothetical protein